MKIYFTSDWHLFHKNILKFTNRNCDDIDHMTEMLIKYYNSIVPENGLCYFLGDMGTNAQKVRTVLQRLNGRKILIIGNHDKGYATAGYDACMFGATINIGGHVVSLSHCPLLGKYREDTSTFKGVVKDPNWHRESDFAKLSLNVPDVAFHLHGHIHSPNRGCSKVLEGNQLDVGVDGNNMKPWSYRQIRSMIDTYVNNKKEGKDG